MPASIDFTDSLRIYSYLTGKNSNIDSCVLATIVEVQGSAPQKEGYSALFNESGLIAGTIGGGIVEYSVQERIKESFYDKHSALCSYNLSGDVSEKNGAICGGRMKILLDAEPLKHAAVFEALVYSIQERIPGVLVTMVVEQEQGKVEISREWVTNSQRSNSGFVAIREVSEPLEELLVVPVSGGCKLVKQCELSEGKVSSVFMQVVVPPPRLVIAGAGHIGKALSQLGKMLGFEIIVWDYRADYVQPELLPYADIVLNGNIEKSLANMEADRNTYVVAVTTGHTNDIEVIRLYVNSPAAYIGMIGSKKKNMLLKEKFLKEGWTTSEQWENLYCPAGLDVKAQSVWEIAVSIAAQLVQVRNMQNQL